MNSGRRIIVTGFALLLAWATLVAPISAKPHAGCVLAAELSVELVCQGAMASCHLEPQSHRVRGCGGLQVIGG